MTGILNIATSGLLAFQQALEVTTNNISNIGTRGYSRQSIYTKASQSHSYAGCFVGTGTQVASIERNYNRFITQKVRETTTNKNEYDIFVQQASQLDKLFSQDGTSVSKSLQSFFASVNQLNNPPDNMAARNLLLQQSNLLASQFNTVQKTIESYQSTNTAQIGDVVNTINQLTSGIAEINKQLDYSPGTPELLDQRDDLLAQLSQYVKVSTVNEDDGSMGVFVGNGQMLVLGNRTNQLSVDFSTTNAFGTHILVTDSNNLSQDISNDLHSGMLGGLFSFEEDVLGFGSQLLGQMAIGLATTFNTQHKLGMDMNSSIGKDFFTDFDSLALQLSRAVPNPQNVGSGVLSISISDISQTQLSDYDLRVSNAGINEIIVTRRSDGQSSTINWTNFPPAPPGGQFVLDGMTVTVDNTLSLVDGDTFILSPTRGAAGKIASMLQDPRELAFAALIRTEASLANTGTGAISLTQTIDTSNVSKDYRIDFTAPNQYNLVNVTDGITTGPFVFTPNTDNLVYIPDSITPAYTVTLSGIPDTGDSFTASYNSGGIGDNRNGLALAGLQEIKAFNGGTSTFYDKYTQLLTGVGGLTAEGNTRGMTADALYKQANSEWNSVSGVNLDEEGSNLLFFNQAFNAASKVVAVANDTMNILFAAMR